MRVPRLIAHRGYQTHYPENTRPAIEAALRAGARFLEFDVQLTADRVPVLSHDTTLERTAGTTISVLDVPASALSGVSVGEPGRLGGRYAGTPLPTLKEICDLLAEWPAVTTFVEIKDDSTARHGVEATVERVLMTLAPRIARFRIISFNPDTVRCARRLGAHGVGWIIRSWDEDTRSAALALQPDYLLCNYRKLPPAPAPLWPGRWQWALYDVTEPSLALELAARGADFISTFAIGEMLADPRLRPA
jgi:glycerophosphoryl diester phosphodiesterase